MIVLKTPFDEEFIAGLADLTTVGRYEIIRKLGEGGAAAVYLGKDRYIKRYVAIKMSQPTADKGRSRFFLEAQSAGRLNHPNIVAIYDADVYKDFCYLTLEYIEGPTLKKFCHKDDILPMSRAVEIVFSACNALDYAHKQGVIHKDIKPSNIMLDKEGAIKITDFGIAQMVGKTAELGVIGTPSYMSPEQAEDGIVGNQADIFSLGCVLYELLTGERAFSGDNSFVIMYKIINKEPEPMLRIRPEIPEILEQITKKALAKDIKERYQSCMAFADELRVALRGLRGIVQNEETSEIVDYVHHVPFFHNFTRDQVNELVSANSIIKVPVGRVVVSEGEISDTFYVILSGKLKIMKGDEKIALIGDGECFGEMAYIAGQARFATVVADTDCILMELNPTFMERLSKSIQFLFFKNFAMTLVRRLSKDSGTATNS
ncbi:MAG: protein kinase [Deltaproteobacteria bacterium]|nr:protein kinase [Deltaproteobacteria bacterium]MBW2118883.1 protein kinase [Deltaproteobacteria bacterium]